MKYRSGIEFDPAHPEASNVIVTTTTGHCAVVGAEWRELPPALHAAAITAGCEVDQARTKATAHKPEASADAVDQSDEAALVTKAIKALLKRNDAEDFTNDGIPKVAAVNKECGFTATKSQVMEAWGALQAEAAE